MLNLKDLKSYYSLNTEIHDINILKEYLQYKILEIIFDSRIGHKLSFIGGTALRIIYNTSRFSEDLDFDSFDLLKTEFKDVSEIIQAKLELEGYKVEIKSHVENKTFHYYIKIPDLLFVNNLSSHKNEKIFIKVDTEPQGVNYKPESKLMDKFNILTYVNVTPIDILLSMKLHAVFSRKRPQGRDFYDVLFLCSKTKPNYNFLKQKLDISNSKSLKEKLLVKCKELDFNKLVKDVEPLIFTSNELKKVLLFKDFIKQAEL